MAPDDPTTTADGDETSPFDGLGPTSPGGPPPSTQTFPVTPSGSDSTPVSAPSSTGSSTSSSTPSDAADPASPATSSGTGSEPPAPEPGSSPPSSSSDPFATGTSLPAQSSGTDLPDTADTSSGVDQPPVEPSKREGDPVEVTFPTDGVDRDTAEARVANDAEVPEGATVVGHNTADGAPVLIDPEYRVRDGGPAQRATLEALRADGNATEAERDSGERTLTAREAVDVLDGALVGMAPALEYRPRKGLRVLRMTQAFRAGSETGMSGDYLAEDADGHRFVIAQADLDTHFAQV